MEKKIAIVASTQDVKNAMIKQQLERHGFEVVSPDKIEELTSFQSKEVKQLVSVINRDAVMPILDNSKAKQSFAKGRAKRKNKKK